MTSYTSTQAQTAIINFSFYDQFSNSFYKDATKLKTVEISTFVIRTEETRSYLLELFNIAKQDNFLRILYVKSEHELCDSCRHDGLQTPFGQAGEPTHEAFSQ